MKTCGQCKHYTTECSKRAEGPAPMWMVASLKTWNEMMRAVLLPEMDASACETFEERAKEAA